jgi:hypothetical protein
MDVSPKAHLPVPHPCKYLYMALFKQKTPEEVAAEKARQAETDFRASPTGRALTAFERGDQFFQVEMTQQTIQSPVFLNPTRDGSTNRRNSFKQTDVLGQIEEVGWHLEHASWVYVQTGMNSKDKVMSSGQWTNVSGEVIGMYLFRRRDDSKPRQISQ